MEKCITWNPPENSIFSLNCFTLLLIPTQIKLAAKDCLTRFKNTVLTFG